MYNLATAVGSLQYGHSVEIERYKYHTRQRLNRRHKPKESMNLTERSRICVHASGKIL